MSYILSYGYYFPHFQIEEKILAPKYGKKGSRSVCYVDEDILTLAFEAANICLNNNTSKIDAVFFATTTPVFKKRYHASIIADWLNITNEITTLDFTATPRSGTDALMLANQLINGDIHKNILVITAEVDFAGIGEEARNSCGHSACAVLVGKEKGIAEINPVQSYGSSMAEEFVYKNSKISLDPRFSREAGFKTNIKSALEKSKINPGVCDSVILNSLYAKLAGGVFIEKGFSEKQFAKDDVIQNFGYTGSCHALLQLTNALDSGKKNILLFDYYNGTNVLEIISQANHSENTLQVFSNKQTKIQTYQDYLTLRKSGNFNSNQYHTTEMFSSEMMNEREKETALYLNGYECENCKTVYFIKSAQCKKCKCSKFTPKALQKTGTVYSLTKEFYFPHSFGPITMAVIDLTGGGRMTVQLTDDMYAEDKNKLVIGSKVKLVLRKMMENGTKPDYFWKCRLI